EGKSLPLTSVGSGQLQSRFGIPEPIGQRASEQSQHWLLWIQTAHYTMYTSKEGGRPPSEGALQNPPKAQLPKTRRRTEWFSSMYTQGEYRIPAHAAQVREQKSPKFPEIS